MLLLPKVQHNPPTKDVVFGYYQKYNNNPPLFTQTLLKVQHNPPFKDVAFGYYQKYNNNYLLKH